MPWIAVAAALRATGDRWARRAAWRGLGSAAAASVAANLAAKAMVARATHAGRHPGSGEIRHRLSRAGNRRINHALHMMAVTQIRNPGTAGRLYYERKRAEGRPGERSPYVRNVPWRALPDISAIPHCTLVSLVLRRACRL